MTKEARNFLLAQALQLRKPVLLASIALSLFALAPAATQSEPPAQAVPFKTFDAQVFVKEQLKQFAVTGNLSVADESDGIKPVTEDMALQVGNFILVIPAGSFRPTWSRAFLFTRVVGNSTVELIVQPLGNARYSFTAVVKGAVPAADSVTVALTVGNDSGSTVVKPHLIVTSIPG